jgi:hypothetical protein
MAGSNRIRAEVDRPTRVRSIVTSIVDRIDILGN